jgi:hypothetical protein
VNWGDALGVLGFVVLVILLWNSHHLTRWGGKHMIEGTIAEGSWLFDGPRWLETPWIGRGLAVLIVLMMGSALIDGS